MGSSSMRVYASAKSTVTKKYCFSSSPAIKMKLSLFVSTACLTKTHAGYSKLHLTCRRRLTNKAYQRESIWMKNIVFYVEQGSLAEQSGLNNAVGAANRA